MVVLVVEIVVAVWVACALGVVVLFLPELRRRETEALRPQDNRSPVADEPADPETEAPRPQDDRSPVADEPADGRQRAFSA